MILEIIQKWETNKSKLEDFFRNYEDPECITYKDIVVAVFNLIVNDNDKNYDVDKMTIIDDGDYQGTLIFLVPKNTYQPCLEDYIVTNTYYGSCGGCDTLEGIKGYGCSKFNDEQISDLLTLSLHLIQKMKYLPTNQYDD